MSNGVAIYTQLLLYSCYSVAVFEAVRSNATAKCRVKINTEYSKMKYTGLVLLLIMVMLSEVLAYSRCLKPDPLQFGGWRTSKRSYSVGTVVTFYCLPGYDLVGSKAIVCVTNRFRTFWVGRAPTCKRRG